uniref:Neck appendage protein n=1 Tax=Siphoviridae sp. ctRNB7 TaxID=2825502 RepID=A0A8S5PVH9_9CAUD|nr:MAG TPA: Neck appendage protein [Siphoviridae sp. ctRNB7]
MQINFNTTRFDILPTDESYRYRSIMGEHTLTLYFSLPTYTDIPTGAWCEFQGERYTLNQPAKVVKHNTHHFEYTLTMDSEGANLRNYKFRNPNDKTLKFPFTASPRYHIQILVDCLNMIDSGWTLGTTIEAPEKLISYNHNNCLEALDMIAKAFETEYEIIGKTIHLHKVEYFKNNPLPLQYGKGKGFKTGVSRTTEQSRITRLYVQGGERNIDRSKYGNKELLLPKSQEYTYEGVTFVSDDKGLSIAIKNAQNNGFINEQSLDLSHIYPKRKGRVSAVFEVDKAKHFYDFTDTTIPQALNFWDMRINGEKMLIYFESGMLSGREFEVQKYDHTQKRFQLVPKEEDGVTMPNDIFKPAIGDEYSVYNMQMPNAYICDNATQSGASWEMMKEACKYLYENRADLFIFTGDLDGIWAKKHWANVGGRLKMGAYIHFSDTEFQRTPVAIRIVGLKEYVNNPYSPQIELSNKVQGQSFATEIRKLQNQEVYFGELNKRTLSETKRSWRNALETIKQVEEAFPEYTKSIIPATVQTMMALVGNKSGQFVFVANKTNPITVPHTLYFDRNNKQLNAGSGWIKHYALGTNDIKPNYSAADYKYWYAPAFISGRLDDKAKTYYLYIKASKVVETAQFVLSETKIDIEQEAGYYHFLYATVNSEYNGERGIAQLNGFTEITGGQIVTSKISSGNGEQFIQLLDKEIIIKANLHITEGNKTEIKQLVNPDLQLLENRLKQYSNEQTNNIRVGGRNLLRNSGRKITNSDYLIARYKLTDKTLKEGERVTLTIKGQLGAGKQSFLIHNTDGWITLTNLIDKGNGIYQNTFNWTFSGNGRTIYENEAVNIYTYMSHVQVNSTIEWIKLERGNHATDWSPAPEDTESRIDQEKQTREQDVATAKAATEAYARTQSELTKAQAIAEANKQAGIAITAEQQTRILQLQQNLQQAKNFAEQKVNELQVGGRNYILKSNDFITNGYKFLGISSLFGNEIVKNDNITLSVDIMFKNLTKEGRLGIEFNIIYTDNTEVYYNVWKWLNNRDIGTSFTERMVNIIQNNHKGKKIKYISSLGLYIQCEAESVKVSNPKIEIGNKPTDWSPAAEDIENKVADIQTDLQNAINNAKALIAVETQNRQQTDTNVSKLVNKTNFLSDTYIEGNTMATGTMILGNSLGVQAGITGVGAANNDVRLWAGSNYKDRSKAPFHVLQDGTLHATNAHISGQIEAQSGKISGNLELLGVLYSGNWEREIVNGKETIKGENVNGGTYYGGRGIIYRQDDRGIYTAIGGVAGSVTGVTESMNVISRKPLYPKSKYNLSSFTGQILSVPPHPNDEIDVSLGYKNNRAQTIYGDTVSFGANSLFEYVYTGVADSGTIHEWLGVTNIFVFSDVASNFREIYLPNASIVVSILSKFGFENISRKELSLSFEITIVLSYSVGGKRIRLSGIEGGYLLDNDGNRFGGGNGYVDLARGDAIKVRYYSGDYYTMVISRNS